MLLILSSGEPSKSPGLTYDEKMKRWQNHLTKQVKLMDERKKERSHFNPSMLYNPEPFGDVPVRELMEGMRGFL
jgi:hypothetical protein